MILKIISYNKDQDYHVCKDEEGKHHKIDIFVDGGLGDLANSPKDLIGKTVQCDYLHPYIEIANNVKLLESTELIKRGN